MIRLSQVKWCIGHFSIVNNHVTNKFVATTRTPDCQKSALINLRRFRVFLLCSSMSTMIAYVAGIFDAEGFVDLRRDKRRTNSFVQRIAIEMTNEEIINLVLQTVQIGKIAKRDRPGKKRIYRWQISSESDLLQFVALLRDKCIVKRPQLLMLDDALHNRVEKDKAAEKIMLAKRPQYNDRGDTVDRDIILKEYKEPCATDLEKVDDAYMAGFIDGDGCIPNSSKFSVCASQTEKFVLDVLRSKLGGRLYGPYDRGFERRRKIWIWKANGDQARAIARRLHPFFIEKKASSSV